MKSKKNLLGSLPLRINADEFVFHTASLWIYFLSCSRVKSANFKYWINFHTRLQLVEYRLALIFPSPLGTSSHTGTTLKVLREEWLILKVWREDWSHTIGSMAPASYKPPISICISGTRAKWTTERSFKCRIVRRSLSNEFSLIKRSAGFWKWSKLVVNLAKGLYQNTLAKRDGRQSSARLARFMPFSLEGNMMSLKVGEELVA